VVENGFCKGENGGRTLRNTSRWVVLRPTLTSIINQGFPDLISSEARLSGSSVFACVIFIIDSSNEGPPVSACEYPARNPTERYSQSATAIFSFYRKPSLPHWSRIGASCRGYLSEFTKTGHPLSSPYAGDSAPGERHAVCNYCGDLGHTSLESTRIYAKADVEALRSVALDLTAVNHGTDASTRSKRSIFSH